MSVSPRATTGALAARPAGLAVRLRTSKDLPGIILVAPAVLTLVALLGYPVIYNLWLGFHQKHAIQPVGTWVGLDELHLLPVQRSAVLGQLLARAGVRPGDGGAPSLSSGWRRRCCSTRISAAG